MFTRGNILFPTDFSHYALYGLKYAIALARKYSGRIHLAHVIDATMVAAGTARGTGLTDADLQMLLGALRDHATNRLDHLVRVIADSGAEAIPHITEGKPGVELIRLVKKFDCDLAVIPTHGRTGLEHAVFGSCCEKVVRGCPVPVLCVKHPARDFVDDTDKGIRLQRILFPTDFSPFSERALPYAHSLCREFDATLVLLHVTEMPVILPEFMPDATGTFAASEESFARAGFERIGAMLGDISFETRLKMGLPYREIVDMAEQDDIDLIVAPTHGHSGLTHLLFGGVTEKVVRLAPCPVLTVRPDACPETVLAQAADVAVIPSPSI